MNSHGARPIQTHKGPCKGSSENGNVRQTRGLWVLEVRKGEIEEIDNLKEQGPAKVGAAPEVDEAELEEVVVGEGGGEVGGCGEGLGREVGLEEGGQVRDLEDIQDDPVVE
jgi:hypothetical protein